MEQIFPYTAAARQAVLYAEKCAKETLSPVTGTEHLLLGLVMEPEGTAGVVLREAGIEEKMLRNLIRELITRLHADVRPQLEIPLPEDEGRLQTELCGVTLENPFLLSSVCTGSYAALTFLCPK